MELASSDSPTVGVLPPPELALELVAVPEDSFTSQASSDAAALAARTLWYADFSDLLPCLSVM